MFFSCSRPFHVCYETPLLYTYHPHFLVLFLKSYVCVACLSFPFGFFLTIVRFDDLPCIGWCFLSFGGVCIWVVDLIFSVAIIITVTLSLPLCASVLGFLCCTVQSWVLTVSEKMYIMDSTMDMMYTYDRTCGNNSNNHDINIFNIFIVRPQYKFVDI